MFQKIFLFLVFIEIFASCNYRVYINGKFDHKINHSEVKWKPQDDSVLVLGANDSIPSAAILINNTHVVYPAPIFSTDHHSFYSLTISISKDEAKRIGANIISISSNRKSNSDRYGLYTQMYILKNPFLLEYKKQTDSLNQISEAINKNFCIVHLKDCTLHSFVLNGKYPVCFNDSLAGYLTRNKNGTHIDLEFDKSGMLSISDRKKPSKRCICSKRGIHLDKGQEYYIYVSGPFKYSGYKFTMVKKFEYENNVLEY